MAKLIALIVYLLASVNISAEHHNVDKNRPTRGDKPKLEKQDALRVLIVDGFNNHDWQLTTRLTKSILESSGLFRVDVSTAPSDQEASGWATWRPMFSQYDVVMQNCNSHGGRPIWPEEVQRELERYVADGGGLYIFHSANNAFPQWPDYNLMIGLGWRDKNFGDAITIDSDEAVIRIPAGQGGNTNHGQRINALITSMSNHPIHDSLPKQWKAADLEIYRYARGPAKNMTVLSYAKEPETGLNFPIEWTVSYGKGRIYNSTYGHVWKGDTNPNGMRCVAFQTILIRAVEWLSNKEISWPTPDNFPTKEAISLD
jgi:type 1 glutamine amidotransferase